MGRTRVAAAVALVAASCVVTVTPSECGAGASHAAGILGELACGSKEPARSLGFVARQGGGASHGGLSIGPGFAARRPGTCSRRAPGQCRMDAGDNSMGERLEAKRMREPPLTRGLRPDSRAAGLEFVAADMPVIPTIYNWSALGLNLGGNPVAAALSIPRPVAPASATQDKEAGNSKLEQQLLQELAQLQSEHSDINEISDRLGMQEMGGAGSVHIMSQRAALKKRKLLLKDKVADVEAKLAQLRPQPVEQNIANEIEESEETEDGDFDDDADSEMESINNMMARLNELGLRPDSVRLMPLRFPLPSPPLFVFCQLFPGLAPCRWRSARCFPACLPPLQASYKCWTHDAFGAQVPPSKDSFFLALMKGLQLAGLRPLKYDFSESTVMGSTSQVLHPHLISC